MLELKQSEHFISVYCAHIPEVVPYWHITYPATKNSSPKLLRKV